MRGVGGKGEEGGGEGVGMGVMVVVVETERYFACVLLFPVLYF